MRLYQYRAVDPEGRPRQGEAHAVDEEALLAELRQRGFTPLDLKEVQEAAPSPAEQARSGPAFSFEMGVSRSTLTLFTRQLAATLTAGLPLLRVVHVLHRKNPSRSMQRVLENVGQELQRGSSFSEALAGHPAVFDPTYVSMVRVGETGGCLPETVTRLSRLLEKDAALRRKLRSALAYPLFTLAFSLLMVYGLLAFGLPAFRDQFESSQIDLARDYPLTYALMKASDAVRNPRNLVLAVVGAGLLFLGYKLTVRSTPGRLMMDTLKYHIPFVQGLIQQAAAARFCRTFATLMQSGMPMMQSLSLVAEAAGNSYVSGKIRGMASHIQAGERVSTALERARLFPDLVVQMAAVGEDAGVLPDMLEKVAIYYEDELDATVGALTALLEPALMIFIGAIVCVFVLAILMPIIGISTASMDQMQGGRRR
ncbi:MAG TPA: type II secretion system F family protein [Candidatus Nitrosotenuis sp.]|nr:type II secretion system F family protein [Candidatus Nitrosotenuis sp.]